jgi:radical SAM protein with 4Fe4S-binding SPASM domain
VLAAPLTVDINVTNRCNLRCSFCSASPSHHSSRHEELTIKEISELFHELDRLGVFVVRIAGGEPLARSDFKDIVEEAGKHLFDTVLLTNALLLDDELISLLLNNRVSVAVSIDGHTAQLHDAARGSPGSWARALGNVAKAQNAGLKVSAMTTVTSLNCSYLTPIATFLGERSFSAVNFILLNFSGQARTQGNFASWSQWSAAIVELSLFMERENPKIGVSVLPPHEDAVPYELLVPLREAGREDLLTSVWGIPREALSAKVHDIGCAAGRTQMTIFENGDVFGCELMRDFPALMAGSVRQQSISEIWRSSRTFAMLRNMRKSDLEGACSGCAMPCGGGCRASAANKTASAYGSDTNCHLHR